VNVDKITPTVEKFVEFYLNNAAELASDVGYVAMPDGAYELALERFRTRTTGTVFGAEGIDATGTRVEEMLRSAMEDTTAADTTAQE
jgi:phosphate transport system substrate-binding protein